MTCSARSGYGPLRAENFQLAFRRLHNPVRTLSVKSFGCSQTAKCPPEGVVDMLIEERELFVGCLLLARQIGQLLVRALNRKGLMIPLSPADTALFRTPTKGH